MIHTTFYFRIQIRLLIYKGVWPLMLWSSTSKQPCSKTSMELTAHVQMVISQVRYNLFLLMEKGSCKYFFQNIGNLF